MILLRLEGQFHTLNDIENADLLQKRYTKLDRLIYLV
jgi:hypothetical protein